MTQPVAIIVGGGPGISASCARLFTREGMKVAVAARNPEKPVLDKLAQEHGVLCLPCDATNPAAVKTLFSEVKASLGNPNLVIHNIDGRPPAVFGKRITEVEADDVMATITNSTFSAFLVGQQAAIHLLDNKMADNGRGTLIFTNASAALKGFPRSGAFAAASQGKAGLAQSMARELGPEGIHVANVPIDGAIGWRQEDGTRAHWLAGENKDENMLDPDYIADCYLQIHRQHRSTWTQEVVLRPWVEKW